MFPVFNLYSPNVVCESKIASTGLEQYSNISSSNCHASDQCDEFCQFNTWRKCVDLPLEDVDDCIASSNATLAECSEFHYDFSGYRTKSSWPFQFANFETVVTKFDLVCSKEWLKASATSLYSLGYLVGGFIERLRNFN